MKIERNDIRTAKTFNELSAGDVFEYEGEIHMKLTDNGGEAYCFDNDTMYTMAIYEELVSLLDATLVIN